MKNKYKILSNILFYFSAIIILILIVRLVDDYQSYLKHPEYSAPYSVYLMSNSIIYVTLAILSIVLSVIYRNKVNK